MLKDTVMSVVASLSTLSGALKAKLEQIGSGILIAFAALLVLSGQLVVVALVVLRAVMVHQVRVITDSLSSREPRRESSTMAGHPPRLPQSPRSCITEGPASSPGSVERATGTSSSRKRAMP